MNRFDYWKECVCESLAEHGVIANAAQVEAIARDVESCHENIGLAFYSPENPLAEELKRTRVELSRERSKVVCKSCGGRGRIISYGGTLQFDSPCHNCGGEGYVNR